MSTETSSVVSTLEASNLSYQFEKVRIESPNINSTSKLLDEVSDGKNIPSNLTYVDDFYDPLTGTSGVAFQDIETGEAIIAYTGT